MRKLSWSPFNVLYIMMLVSNVFNFMLNSVLSSYAREYVGATISEFGFIFAAWSILPIITVPLVGLYLRGTQLLYAPAIASTILTISSIGMALSASARAEKPQSYLPSSRWSNAS